MLQNLFIEFFPILYQEHNGVCCDWASFNVTEQNKQKNFLIVMDWLISCELVSKFGIDYIG
jgi:hypothetical protein